MKQIETDRPLRNLTIILSVTMLLAGCAGDRGTETTSRPAEKSEPNSAPATLDLREPMSLAAGAIVRRLDPAQEYRPWFLLRGRDGIPATPEHASWDLGDMTGRYLEGLILTRRMGVSHPEFSTAEGRLGRYLLKLLGPDGLVHDPQTGAVDHSFSQGSALYGLLAWFEDSGDPAIRQAIERLISGQLARMERQGDQLVDKTVKLEQSSGSTANDLIGNDDIEGCGAGGGVQGLALAWNTQAEWRDVPGGKELRVHLLFDRAVHGPPEARLTSGTPIGAQVWSWLPYEGRAAVVAHQPLARLALRLPDGADPNGVRVQRCSSSGKHSRQSPATLDGQYVIVSDVTAGERIDIAFALTEYETIETAADIRYRVQWKGSTVLGLEPKGSKVPLYAHRASLRECKTPLCPPRYP